MPALYTSQVFPGGQKKNLVVSATAGNVITNLVPGVGYRWRVLRGLITLTCDATVANRYIRLQDTDGVNIVEYLGGSTVLTATVVGAINFGKSQLGAGVDTRGYTLLGYLTIGDLIIDNLDELRISITAGVAGDSYSAEIVVLEMVVN